MIALKVQLFCCYCEKSRSVLQTHDLVYLDTEKPFPILEGWQHVRTGDKRVYDVVCSNSCRTAWMEQPRVQSPQ